MSSKIPALKEKIKAKLRVGVQTDVQVTSRNWGESAHEWNGAPQLVTQVFCSACPVSHSAINPNRWDLMRQEDKQKTQAKWEKLARLILEATYEATMHAAVLNAHQHAYKFGSNRVFLTRVGGGDFGNSDAWISEAIDKVRWDFAGYNLHVFEVVFQ
jgi:hypothetical protein